MSIRWMQSMQPEARVAIEIWPVTRDGLTVVQHRSETVRSARNIWSFPTGLLEIGETFTERATKELMEEHSVVAIGEGIVLGAYANIAPELVRNPTAEQFHWIIVQVGIIVSSLDEETIKNNEPTKHDQVEVHSLGKLLQKSWWEAHNFSPAFQTYVGPPGIRSGKLEQNLQKLSRLRGLR